ncbi:MAG: glycosyltransferase family 39 protein [Endomicrobiaceae bacterium]|nr:glycosyltransferase family 39 protein [Endomicrobiaceae bacterium]MDD3922461.1 glycosyltransferase family 39 protein [Endomicrobiaceae bacterium]MDD5101357.1 glycosyltransferase family 39 protein [Endomicrobiaceae bacterium]
MIKKIFQNINIKFLITLTLIVFALYSKSLFFDFTYFDDDVLILDKQEYLKISNIKNILTDTVFARGQDKFCRPLLNISFLIEKYIYGVTPWGYHLTNIIIHIFAVFSIFLLLSLKYDKKKVFLVSILFACHPVLTQAVVWIPGRNDSLITLFVVLSFYFLVKCLDNKKINFIVFHFLCFACSLLTKETAIVMPVFYITYLLSKKQTIKIKSFFIISWVFMILSYFIYRHFVLEYQTYSVAFHQLCSTFFHSLPATTKYIANIFFPFNLSVFSSTVEINYLLSIASILVFLLMLSISKHKYDIKNLLFGLSWFFICLFPTFVMPNNQFYDHRIYLPMFGVLIVILEMLKSYDKIHEKKIVMFLIIITIIFAFLSFLHENKFKNKQAFWINALIDSPNSAITNASVAGILDEVGMYKEAEEKYLKAIKIQEYSKHYVNLAVLYLHMKEVDKAEATLLKALELRDDNPMIYYNLAIIYKHKGNKDLAIQMKNLYLTVFKDTNKYQKPEDIKI